MNLNDAIPSNALDGKGWAELLLQKPHFSSLCQDLH